MNGPPVDDACYSTLAAAVLHRALVDLRGPSLQYRQHADAFLNSRDDLAFWCAVASVDPRVIRERARRPPSACTRRIERPRVEPDDDDEDEPA